MESPPQPSPEEKQSLPPEVPTFAEENVFEEGSSSFEGPTDAEAFLAQVDNLVQETKQVVVSEVNAAARENAEYLRMRMNRLATTVITQLKDLTIQTHICRFKYKKYSRSLSIMQIASIFLAIFISLFATVKIIAEREYNGTLTGAAAIVVEGITPTVAAAIALLGAVAKQKKLAEKMENISRIIEKSSYIQSRLPSFIDRIQNCATFVDFDKIEAEYMGETSTLLNSCADQIVQVLNLEDNVIHSDNIQYLKLRKKTSDADYVVEAAKIKKIKDLRLAQIHTMAIPDLENQIRPFDAVRKSVTPVHNDTCWSRLCPCTTPKT